MKRNKHAKPKKLTERAGFYVALSVCLMAIGMAVWSAYTALGGGSLDNDDSSYFSSLSATSAAAVAQDMTGVQGTEDTQSAAQDNTQAPSEPETRQQEQPRSIALSETMPSQAPSSAEEGALTTMQAVMKVDESLIYPVKSHKVLKQFSEESVYNKTMRDYRSHTGCDFEAEEGENVYAMCSGTVENISSSELYGVIIEVDCGDYSVYYCGMSSELSVDKGNEITAGDTIGTVGQIPSETADGAHVHIEVRVADKLIDPLSVIESDG